MKRKAIIYSGIGGLSVGVLALLWFALARHDHDQDFTKIPLARSDYLKEVAEPITIADSIAWDDGGSKGISFRDSKAVVRSACLMDDLNDNKNLIFGSVDMDHGRKVAIGGPEEQAFLGLLQRWCLQDPQAREWAGRIERWLRSDQKRSILSGDETVEQRHTMQAVGMMIKLSRRN